MRSSLDLHFLRRGEISTNNSGRNSEEKRNDKQDISEHPCLGYTRVERVAGVILGHRPQLSANFEAG